MKKIIKVLTWTFVCTLLPALMLIGGTAKEEESGKEVTKGTFVFLSAENLLGEWDPASQTNLAHARLEPNVYDSLVTADKDSNLQPCLATSWNVVDERTIEFNLREGVKFHEGQTFTGEDVRASLEHWSNPKSIGSLWFTGKLQVEVKDPYTVWVRTPGPDGTLMYTLTRIAIMCKDDVRNPENFKKRMNGTGPFKYVKYENDAVYTVANEEYWDGAPKIGEFIYKYVGDPNTRLAALLTGEAHMIDRVPPEHVATIEESKNSYVDKTLTVEQKWLHFRCAIPPFDTNIKLRKAIAYAIDKETIVHSILNDFGKVSDSFLSTKQFGYASAPNAISYDPEKAKKLLAEAGYPNGEGLQELEYITSVGFYPKTKEYGEFIVENLRAIGVKVKYVTMETAAWNDKYYVADAGHMIDGGWMGMSPEPDAVLRAHFYTEGRVNHVSNPEIDAVLDKEASENNLDVRAEIIANEVNPLLMDKIPSYPLFVSMLLTGVSNSVKNLEILPSSIYYLKDVELVE